MILQHVTEHPVQRVPIHADFFVVKMSEEMVVDVPISFVGESDAIKKLGGSLLHQRETVSVRALPDALPSAIEVDISGMEDFEATIHVSDVIAPAGVTILTDGAEPLARIQAPRQSDEPVIAGPAAPVQETEAAEEASKESTILAGATPGPTQIRESPGSDAGAPSCSGLRALGELVADLGQQLDSRSGRRVASPSCCAPR